MIRSGELPFVFHTCGSGGKSEGAFGGDMNVVWFDLSKHLSNASFRKDCQPNFSVGGEWKVVK